MFPIIFYCLFILASQRLRAELFELSICAIFQNEAPYLYEWIQYHRLLGVEHFYLYNDRSTDPYLEVLSPLIEEGIVELFDCSALSGESHFLNQRRAYVRAFNAARQKSRWMAVIDIDEFIVPKNVDTIPDLLRMYEEEWGVMIHWQKFGTSGLWELPSKKFMIECLTKAAPIDDEDHRMTKSIVQIGRLPECFFDEEHILQNRIDLVHFNVWESYDGTKARSLGSIRLHGKPQKELFFSEVQINHYWCRTEKYYREEKVLRKTRLNHEDFGSPRYWSEEKILKYLSIYNLREDISIQRFVPSLKEFISNRFDK